jgi:hypothetical protein
VAARLLQGTRVRSGMAGSHKSGHPQRRSERVKPTYCVEKVRFSDRSQLSRPLTCFENFWLGGRASVVLACR